MGSRLLKVSQVCAKQNLVIFFSIEVLKITLNDLTLPDQIAEALLRYFNCHKLVRIS